MAKARRELTGEVHVRGDGTFTIFDHEAGKYVKAYESDRETAVAEQVGDEAWHWTVTLDKAATTEDLDLDATEWAGLFSHSNQRGEPPSIHNSWCLKCTSVGVSHGVCC
jgi:hypothetical protein